MEKLKDFLYDIADLIILFIVVALIIFFISWRVKVIFSYNSKEETLKEVDVMDNYQKDKTEDVSSNTEKKNDIINTKEDKYSIEEENKDEINTSDDDTMTKEDNSEEVKDIITDDETNIEDEETSVSVIENKANNNDFQEDEKIIENEIINVVVPKNSFGTDIAKILFDKNLITSTRSFLMRASEMRLDTSFKAGEYDIKKGTSLDKIIMVISRTDISQISNNNFIVVNIPSGAYPSLIASILIQNNLIKNKTEFLLKLKEMELDTKLRAGKFNIPNDASIENIIKILTGTKRS